ncbi:MAG: hypothetical protein ACKODY_03145 [Actinomycetota bacterium]
MCEGFHGTASVCSLAELRAVLGAGDVDALVVGHFAVAQFMIFQPALEREGLIEFLRVIATRGEPVSTAPDAAALGFEAAVDLGLRTTAASFLPVITEICRVGRHGFVPLNLSDGDHRRIREKFSVLYADALDQAVGAFVAAGETNGSIATRLRVQETEVESRITAIIQRSRLLDRRELGAYHAGAVILDGSVSPTTSALPRTR